MGKVELIRVKDDLALSQMAAQQWLSTLDPGRRYCVAFSGGRIAAKFFQALVAHPRHKLLACREMHFFFADERCVPPEHPDSNYRLMKEHFADQLKIPEDHIHRIPGELLPSAAAEKATQDFLNGCGRDANGVPAFDIIFLGMGEDGHVASIFPADPEIESPDLYRAVIASKPPPNRITLGLHIILRAKEVWVLASGAGKANALRESLDPKGDTPLASVVRGRSKTVVFTDVLPAE